MQLLLDHSDSPYIRCIGFLYLRYACPPSMLWDRIKPYVNEDDVRFAVTRCGKSSDKDEVTMGQYVRILFDSSCEYHGTRLPRLESTVARDLQVQLLRISKLEKRAESNCASRSKMDYLTIVGNKVRALYEDASTPSTWYDAVVDRVLAAKGNSRKPKFIVTFPQYGNTETVTLGEIDMPLGYRDTDRGDDSNLPRRGGQDLYRSREERTNDHVDTLTNNKKRKYADERGYDHRYQSNRGYQGHRNFENGEHNRHGDEKELMNEVLRQERDRTTTGQKRAYYASRPATTKDSLSSDNNYKNHDHWREQKAKSSFSQGSHRDRRHDSNAESDNAITPATQKPKRTQEELAAVAEKKRKLLTRYG